MSTMAKNYMNIVILKLIRQFNLTEKEATELVMNSYLYKSLLAFPEQATHDDADETAATLYNDYIAGVA